MAVEDSPFETNSSGEHRELDFPHVSWKFHIFGHNPHDIKLVFAKIVFNFAIAKLRQRVE